MIDVRNTREKYGYGNVPQLIIYRINKGDKDIKVKIQNLEKTRFSRGHYWNKYYASVSL